MNGLLNRLFGLEGVGFGDEGVRLTAQHPLPQWAWALLLLGACVAGYWSYRRMQGNRLARALLALTRAAVIAIVVLLLTGPRLERPNTRIENDRVVVLLDRSGSMNVRDEPGRATRDSTLRTAAAALETSLGAAREPKDRTWLAFDADAYELPGPEGLPPADGRRTSMDSALRGAIAAGAGRPLSAVVLLTDGRSPDPVSPETMQRLLEDQVPVFAVALGSTSPPTDLAVTRVDAPTVAFTGDRVPVRATVTVAGSETEADIDRTRVQLVDADTGEVLATQPLSSGVPARGDDPEHTALDLTLLADAAGAGDKRWAVRLAPAGEDLEPGNDERAFSIALTDRPIRVMQIDGYPRWEFRYVRGLLLREPTIESVSLMLSPDRRFMQEGDITLASLPTSPEEWADFDVVIIGDVRPELFGSAALESLREHVAERGAGLIWMAGPDVPTGSWARTELGDLLPVSAARIPETGLPEWDREVVLARTEQAGRRGLLALDDDGLSWPDRLQDPATGWSRLRWAQRLDPALVKPGAEVLATAVPIDLATLTGSELHASGTPALLLMRYGAGRSLYSATEETWRWRYGRGEDLQERFWLPLVRQLARARVERVGQPAVLRATPADATVGSTVRLDLELIDQALIDTAPPAIELVVGQPDDTGALARTTKITLAPESQDRRRYGAVWSPPESGPWSVRSSDAFLVGTDLEAGVRAHWSGDEQREPAADHDSLQRLADETGGELLDASEIATLAQRFPNRRLVLDAAPDLATLWDKPVWLALLLVLLSGEWIGRKLLRLV
ncbi:MAG: hypothetical protein ACF8Q5_12220 [Phycisphaerales bacterium JB040]